jgi:GNAT superfamily N-acetyltransferase
VTDFTTQELIAVTEATWPPAARIPFGPFTLRDGAGGGKRVSSATAEAPVTKGDIATAAERMRAMGQPSLFQIRPGDEALDAMLDAQGYAVIDPVVGWVAPVAAMADPGLHRLAAIACEAPLAIQREIWAEGRIGSDRLAVMARAATPHTYLLGRLKDRPAGTAFVAIHEGTAMLHALEVHPDFRRQGVARGLMTGAANWAKKHGAARIAVLVTRANAAANPLYASLGMAEVEGYHYRIAN